MRWCWQHLRDSARIITDHLRRTGSWLAFQLPIPNTSVRVRRPATTEQRVLRFPHRGLGGCPSTHIRASAQALADRLHADAMKLNLAMLALCLAISSLDAAVTVDHSGGDHSSSVVHVMGPERDTATMAIAGESSSFDWPSGSEVPVIRGFDNPEQAWKPGHRGVDLAMSEGQDVLAAGSGVVIYAGRINDRSVISLEHANGLRTTYEPVDPSVSKGDHVDTGDVIGTLVLGHLGPLPVLHWGAKFPGDVYIDPLGLIEPVEIRLWE